MRSFAFLLSVSLIACLACTPDESAQVDVPVSHADEPGIWQARIERNENGITGHLYISVGDLEWPVYDQAMQYWMSEDNETIYWSYPHRKSAFEVSGEGLRRYQTASDKTEIVFEDDLVIDFVEEVQSKSGRTALLVRMSEGGPGAGTVAVVDPDRGRVFREQFASVVQFESGVITVELYDAQSVAELDGRDIPTPTLTQEYDLDDLLDREADREILFPLPPE